MEEVGGGGERQCILTGGQEDSVIPSLISGGDCGEGDLGDECSLALGGGC